MNDLRVQFGDIDIYLFDQLLRGRIAPGMHVIDAGCGGGRNLVYLLRNGYNVAAVDRDPRRSSGFVPSPPSSTRRCPRITFASSRSKR